ncbi:type I pantothenate kinase [Dongia soli]|uniref:Pantothenate kinase n=1 Tax=Dongia soli TaxID=600628 RepID=A0ABU5E7C4_9PROT|nr:type I pantothenate kinase [Dongia soli]MDY0881929.1 type I pantothenate kinase [Dongia soli]
MALSGYLSFAREDWAELRSNTPLTLSEHDLSILRGLNERTSLSEVVDIYLPLSRLLNLQVRAARNLSGAKDAFLGRLAGSRPYVIAIAGSVAVGKSTLARILQALMARWPDHPRVALVTTDGFLHPNRLLQERGLMHRKGFPESYDLKRMVQFLADLKAGEPEVRAPVYSHHAYDILPDEWQMVSQPDVLIFEGLNVLQAGGAASSGQRPPSVIISDFFDFSLYIDAEEADIESWYVERFQLLQRTAFRKPSSYFHHYRDLSPDESVATAKRIWAEINLVNLRENILPTRERAHLILKKRADHAIGEIHLRQL